jgi:thienamycin biosynthesis protein ThnN
MNNDLFTERLGRVMACHLDPTGGSTYWLEKADQLGLACSEIQTIDDLTRFGPMDEDALRTRPIEDFIPQSTLQRKTELILGETGGTKGKSKVTAYREDEFHEAFVAPFVQVARYRSFPEAENWIWIGPGGPHVIGKAAQACARASGSADPFSVDFDARWAKKLPPGSMAARRYLAHVVQQSIDLIETQRIGVIFSTPKVFEKLGESMSDAARQAIKGLHFGGMPVDGPLMDKLMAAFPNAVLISGYGNTLFGMCPEFTGVYDGAIQYYPFGDRLVFRTVQPDSNLSNAEKLSAPVAAGEPGQVVFSRLDEAFMILNMFERDEGALIQPPPELQALGFRAHGISDPKPLRAEAQTTEARIGLY